MSSVVFASLFLIALVAPFVLYALIEQETEKPRVVDRAEAEREAQRRGGLDRNRRQSSSNRSDGDGSSDHWGYSRLDDERE